MDFAIEQPILYVQCVSSFVAHSRVKQHKAYEWGMLGGLSSLSARLRLGSALASTSTCTRLGGRVFALASCRTRAPQLPHLITPLLKPKFCHAKNNNDVGRLVSTCSTSQKAAFEHSSLLPPGLYLVGTPIGNLEDLSVRALKVLQTATIILAEDTRHSRKLLNHYNIDAHLHSFHQHNEHSKQDRVRAICKPSPAFAFDCCSHDLHCHGKHIQKSCTRFQVLAQLSHGSSVALISDAGDFRNQQPFIA